MGKTYGYARVSTREQNLDRQLDALGERGIAGRELFCDKATGANFDRPGFQGLMRQLREGDLVVVASVDRLGRDYGEIQEVWRRITKEIGADVEVLDMPLLNTRNSIEGLTGIFVADLVLQIMCYLAQMERDKTKERQREGIEAAKRRGVKFGPEFKPVPGNFPEVHAAFLRGEVTRKEAGELLGVSASTFDRWRKAADIAEPEAKDDADVDSGAEEAWRKAAGIGPSGDAEGGAEAAE
ncbi:MAG: recombinase family protein [Atopobiaceae bacterium]|nr:recombinase family protein [Atopobiaceae bacterium]